jgi:hypothetical protein
MKSSKPECDISIFNYHYETRKVDCSKEKAEYKRIKHHIKDKREGWKGMNQ